MKKDNNANAPSPLHEREIIMPDDFIPDMDNILSGEEEDSTESAADTYESKDSTEIPVTFETTPQISEADSDHMDEKTLTEQTLSEESDWDSFIEELKAYDTPGNRQERTSCRMDLELWVSLEEIEILGYSRPDILSAMVRVFLKRHLSRLKELRRAKKKSIFTN